MAKKILIIDDSALMRRIESDIIESDERFCVRDTASNGLEALNLIISSPKLYDAVILDINMPRMNGLQLLEVLEHNKLKLPIVVVSTAAVEGANETIRCLELGAFDFVTKPDKLADVRTDVFKERLLATVAAAVFNGEKVSEKYTAPVMKTRKSIFNHQGNRKLVAIASSTGGPKALNRVITALPANLDAPVLIMQHMPVGFTKSLALRLDELSEIGVKEAEDNDILKKGMVYIAKGGSQMKVKEGNSANSLVVKEDDGTNILKPCADITYESLIKSNFDYVLCVVLTGMGSDGTEGIKKLHNHKDTYIIAQDEETSVVYGMPKVIYQSGLVDEVRPLDEIAERIIKNVGVQTHGC